MKYSLSFASKIQGSFLKSYNNRVLAPGRPTPKGQAGGADYGVGLGASYLQSPGKGNGSWASKVIPAYVKLSESCVFCQGGSKCLPFRNTKTDFLILCSLLQKMILIPAVCQGVCWA